LRKKYIRQKDFFHLSKYAVHMENYQFPSFPFISLELGCGNGFFLTNLANRHKNRFYIGFDIKSDRLWKGCALADKMNLENIAFSRILIQNIDQYFPDNSIDEIWLLFSDPFPKPSKANQRLTHPDYLKKYYSILKNNGIIHVKTDSELLFDYSYSSLIETEKFKINKKIQNIEYSAEKEDYYLPTHYEMIWRKQNRTISYLQALK